MKYLLPISIVIGSIIISITLISIQTEKSNQERENKREAADIAFYEREEKKCEDLADGLKTRWNNVIGVSYNRGWFDCEVTFLDPETNEITYGRLSNMQTAE